MGAGGECACQLSVKNFITLSVSVKVFALCPLLVNLG